MNNINLESTSTLQELEASLSTLNTPIVMFKMLLEAIRTNDFSNIAQTVMKERYTQSEDLVTTHIDNVVYQNIYNHEDYNNVILLITKLYSIINTLVSTRFNITNIYELDSDIIDEILLSYGFDIYDIFDSNSRQNIAYKIYSFLRKKGTPALLGDFMTQLGYTFFTINEYNLNRSNNEWCLVPETVYYSETALQYKDELIRGDNIKLRDVDDMLWYLDEITLNNVVFKSTFIYPKNWACTYNIDIFKYLQQYLQLPDYVSIESVNSFNFNSFTNKINTTLKVNYPVAVNHDSVPSNRFIFSYDVEDGVGGILVTKPVDDISGDPQFKTKTICCILDAKTNTVERKYTIYDQSWYDYYLQQYLDTYSEWQSNTDYSVGTIVIYNGLPVECIREHISGSIFDYTQDDKLTWVDVYIESNWWVKQNLMSSFVCNITSNISCSFISDNDLLFTSSDDNTVAMIINIISNDVTKFDLTDVFNIIDNMQLSEYLNNNNIKINNIYNYNDFLFILLSNDIIVLDKRYNAWFSLKDELLSKLTIIFNIDLGSKPLNKFMCNDGYMYFIDNSSGIVGFDIYKLENYITQCISLVTTSEREAFTQNISDDIFLYDIIDFFLDDNISFFIGRDKKIYISGKVIGYDYLLSSYKTYTDDYMCICYDIDTEQSIQIPHSGSLLRFVGMDSLGNLRCVNDNDFNWELYLFGDTYYKVNTYFNYVFKPILNLAYYEWISYNTPDMIISYYNPLQVGAPLDPIYYNDIYLL